MGVRFRLRTNYDISSFSAANQVILNALKRYGMIVADNGSPWYLSGAPDPRWNDSDLHNLTQLSGADFEAVDVSPFMVNANSAQAASCDLNNDGVVNILDVQVEVNAALSLGVCGIGDVNGDGVCNVIDVQRVVRAALGLGCRIGP